MAESKANKALPYVLDTILFYADKGDAAGCLKVGVGLYIASQVG